VDAGREIDVVVTKGVHIQEAEAATSAPIGQGHAPEGADRFTRKDNDDE
jgi:hypothetical protein